jgi:hypothetical protein
MNFGGWGLGGGIASLIIRKNRILNFGRYGIYDSAKSQNAVEILQNQIYSPNAVWAVYTEHALNRWKIQNNGFTIGILEGDQAVNAPGSTVGGNTPYVEENIVSVQIKNEESTEQIVIVRTIVVSDETYTIPPGESTTIDFDPSKSILVLKESSA